MLDGQRTMSLITGASRGIGRQLALELATRSAAGSAFLITARNEQLLQEVKRDIQARNNGARVFIVLADMGDLNDKARKDFEEALGEMTAEKYDAFYLFHNAGYLGDVSKKALDLNDAENWKTFLNDNFIAMVLLNNLVLAKITNKVCALRYVINMSSILAVQGFPSFCQHACGKAAREGFFRGLACEEDSLRVLNYCPGPVLTDMYLIVQDKSYDATVREAYTVDEKEKQGGGVHLERLTPQQTTRRLLDILHKDNFTSGSRIDYFDKE